jgi:hypothetical protein
MDESVFKLSKIFGTDPPSGHYVLVRPYRSPPRPARTWPTRRCGSCAPAAPTTITALAKLFRVPCSTDGLDADAVTERVAMLTRLRDVGNTCIGLRALADPDPEAWCVVVDGGAAAEHGHQGDA